MVDNWLENHHHLFLDNADFREHVKNWASHVIMQAYSLSDLDGMVSLYQKYRPILTSRGHLKYLAGKGLLQINKILLG